MPITHSTIPVAPAQVGEAEWGEEHTLPTAAEIGAAEEVHGHAISDVTGLQTALDGKQASGSYAAAGHGHDISDVSGLGAALDAKLDDSQASVFGLSLLDDADAAAARATMGLGSAAVLAAPASGDASSGQVVKGDDSRLSDARTPTTHAHDIADVTGLQDALDDKLDAVAEAATVATIAGKVSAGANVSLSGTGTDADPFVVAATAGGLTHPQILARGLGA